MQARRTRWAVAGVGGGDRRRSPSVSDSSRRLSSARPCMAPAFEVDPLWPKPLPNGWVLGMVIGVGVDSQDHVFIVHRGDGDAQPAHRGRRNAARPAPCCPSAPPVLEFDPEGNLVNSWGGPAEGYVWPAVEPRHRHRPPGQRLDRRQRHARFHRGIGFDSHILKFTHDGKFLQQIGVPGQRADSQSMDALRPRRQDLVRRNARTKPTSPTATATSASRCST